MGQAGGGGARLSEATTKKAGSYIPVTQPSLTGASRGHRNLSVYETLTCRKLVFGMSAEHLPPARE